MDEETVSYYISVISRNSSRYGDLLLKFLSQYHLQGLIDATATQLKEFIEQEGLSCDIPQSDLQTFQGRHLSYPRPCKVRE